jgi:CHASE2 domain-containing sensor protein
MKKKVSFKDALLASLFIVFSAWIISLVTSNINSDLLNPIEKTFSDFKLTDVYFSHFKESPDVSEDIVLVNIGNLPRAGSETQAGIADLLNVINKYEPKVVAIDAFFRNLKPNSPEGDSLLALAFKMTKNLVLVSELHENPETSKIDSISYSHPWFMKNARPGFADMITAGKGHFNVARECPVTDNFKGREIFSFPVQIAAIYDKEATERFLARNNRTEDINYQGNIITGSAGATENSKNVFFALDHYQVLNEQFEPEAIKGKIVILGFMGSAIGDPSWEDRFFTPLNPNYLGKTNPDMFGVVVHANIVAMIIKGDFINEMPLYLDYLLSMVFVFLNVWLFSWMFLNLEEWWDGVSLLVTLAEVVLLTIFTIFIFHTYNYKYDISLPMVALFLTGNLVEIYFGLIVPSVKKIFKKNSGSLSGNENEITNQTEFEKTL